MVRDRLSCTKTSGCVKLNILVGKYVKNIKIHYTHKIVEAFGTSGMVIITMILVATFCFSVSHQKVPLFYYYFPVSNILQCLMVRQQQPCVHIACFH